MCWSERGWISSPLVDMPLPAIDGISILTTCLQYPTKFFLPLLLLLFFFFFFLLFFWALGGLGQVLAI
jgi:hypothetical protein